MTEGLKIKNVFSIEKEVPLPIHKRLSGKTKVTVKITIDAREVSIPEGMTEESIKKDFEEFYGPVTSFLAKYIGASQAIRFCWKVEASNLLWNRLAKSLDPLQDFLISVFDKWDEEEKSKGKNSED